MPAFLWVLYLLIWRAGIFHARIMDRDRGKMGMAGTAKGAQAQRARDAALRAQAHLAAGRTAEALAGAQEAGALFPGDIFAQIIQGQALMALDRAEEAAEIFQTASRLVPDDPPLLILLGNARRTTGAHAAAAAAYRAVTRLWPDMAGAWHNLGLALITLDQPVDAAAALRRACALDPTAAASWNSLGAALNDRGALSAALCAFIEAGRVARAGGREARRATWNEAVLRLARGEMARGWELYEHRAGGRQGPTAPPFGLPFVNGMPRPGMRVLITVEQGLGDVIMTLRFLPLLAAQGVDIILQRPEPLRRLLAGFPGVAGFLDDGETPPPVDGVIPCMSLPGLFVRDADHVPGIVPYLHADPLLVDQWRPALSAAQGLRVGFVWAGNPDHSRDRHRSLPLAAMLPLMHLPGITPVILQRGSGRTGLEVPGRLPNHAIDLGQAVADTADTLAILTQLDLLVSCCTMPAHLAGAAGLPVSILLDAAPDWRWGMEGSRSPWYQGAWLYRQELHSDWNGPVGRIAADLSRR